MEYLEYSIEEHIQLKKNEPGCNYEAMMIDLVQ